MTALTLGQREAIVEEWHRRIPEVDWDELWELSQMVENDDERRALWHEVFENDEGKIIGRVLKYLQKYRAETEYYPKCLKCGDTVLGSQDSLCSNCI